MHLKPLLESAFSSAIHNCTFYYWARLLVGCFAWNLAVVAFAEMQQQKDVIAFERANGDIVCCSRWFGIRLYPKGKLLPDDHRWDPPPSKDATVLGVSKSRDGARCFFVMQSNAGPDKSNKSGPSGILIVTCIELQDFEVVWSTNTDLEIGQVSEKRNVSFVTAFERENVLTLVAASTQNQKVAIVFHDFNTTNGD